jgi:hypothetical protein
MDERFQLGLLLLASFAGIWGVVYARRAYMNTKKILEKIGL